MNKYPFDVTDTLSDLGKKISASRRARQITQQELADRAGLSRATIINIEKGSPDISIGNYGAAMWAMDMHKALSKGMESDEVALQLMESALPKRVRRF